MGRTQELLGGDVRVEAKSGYVFVWHGRAARDVAELGHILRAIESALRASRCHRLLFDSRDSAQTPEDVQTKLWSWLENMQLEKVGTLVRSSNLAVSVRMTGLSKHVKIRAFDSMLEAEKWLQAE